MNTQLSTSFAMLLQTDRSGTVLGARHVGALKFAYPPYGHRLADEASSLIGFNGQLEERQITGYMLGNGYRAFNVVLMRFNSPDGWSPFGKGGINPYCYCSGDPINFTDSTGFMAKSIKIGGMFNIRRIGEGGTSFTDESGRRLYINSHGNVDRKGRGYLDIDGKKQYPKDVMRLLSKAGVQVDKYDLVDVLACHSAAGKKPFIEGFANVSSKIVKGYENEIALSPSADEFSKFYDFTKGRFKNGSEFSNYPNEVYIDRSRDDYRGVKAYPRVELSVWRNLFVRR
ncbi:RHS repeat-associated core domain-containing protein [Pseudomonas sp. R5(2019)]|uniref:RHS repeat-associated core domain-containing protein n=1 Tax=Pseudomonas sp. R5(2019) TaxID=2697566 RepID=UPI001412F586|nr:RHS repeat-associated core domain-containing protein [Pseudomonas sp. R5(2019)]NBA93866.1 hypothetical protein [Pseudomonas sp. R5(2019)]